MARQRALDPRDGDTRWITRTVALLAICVFTVSGAQILPEILNASGGSRPVPNGQLSAFLLNIALILLAWRRSKQLRQTTEQRDAAEDLAYRLAYYDELTGLLNRRHLKELLEELCAKAVGKSALVLLDLDHFKKVNDLHGHAAGDQLLSALAKRILDNCPADASCFRLGGDEFAVVLYGAAAGAKEATEIAEGLLEALVRPVAVIDTTLAATASIGIARITKQCRDPATVLERADLAMYEAKRLGRHRCMVFDRSMEGEFERRKKLESELREGIVSGQFVPYFQPIFDLVTAEVTAFEVLARWKHPGRGLLEPAEFIEAAERTGLISELSFGVMLEALSIARAWPGHLKVCVNISHVQFTDPLIAQRIMKVLSLTGFPAQRLEVEIVERSLLDDPALAQSIIGSLKNSGISVSVDDFGIGYGSLAQLESLPFDRIKIDRSFIAALLDDQRCGALVAAIATLGKGLKMPITAEGVEAETLQSRLTELGCTDAQGWVYSHALSAKEVILGFGDRWGASVPAALRETTVSGEERRTAGA